MVDTIYTSQTPVSTAFDFITHSLGMEFTVSSNSSVTGGRAWVTSGGRPVTFFWQLWRVSDTTLLAECNLNLLPPPSPGWMSFTSANFITPGDVAVVTTESYVVNVFTDDGDFVFTDDGSETFPIGTGIVSSSQGRFRNGGIQTDFPNSTGVTYFFADVNVGADTVTGTLDITFPAFIFELTGEVTVSGSLNMVAPAAQLDLVGLVTVEGSLTETFPGFQWLLSGASAAGGAIMGPCGWIIPAPLCCDEWTTFSPAIQAAAQDYAALVLWAATGRQFGLCTVQVRPCGMKRCNDQLVEFYGFDWSGGTWVPYIFNGTWFNCSCVGLCCCDPRCQVRLMGPVDSITEVTIGGIAVDPNTYRVDDGHWLVRTGGQCWPTCADLDTDDGDNVFVVTYVRGSGVPPALLQAAATLACEWAKACVGAECRLSNRVTSLARNGITIDMASPEQFLDDGLTGLWEVDSVIVALNPYRRKQRSRIYAPELNVPRQVTTP